MDYSNLASGCILFKMRWAKELLSLVRIRTASSKTSNGIEIFTMCWMT